MSFERDGRNAGHDQVSGLTGRPVEMRGSAQTEAQEVRREGLEGGIHRTGALLESKVRVVEEDEADKADGAIKTPDKEGDIEPVVDPGGGRE